MIICGLKWVDMNRRMRIWIFFKIFLTVLGSQLNYEGRTEIFLKSLFIFMASLIIAMSHQPTTVVHLLI